MLAYFIGDTKTQMNLTIENDVLEMDLELSRLLIAWNDFETEHHGDGVIDFNVAESGLTGGPKFESRLEIIQQMERLSAHINSKSEKSKTYRKFLKKLNAHKAYLSANCGQKFAWADFVEKTQGVTRNFLSTDYLNARAEYIKKEIIGLGMSANANWFSEMTKIEQNIPETDVGGYFVESFEKNKSNLIGVLDQLPEFDVKIDFVKESAYWNYWVDGTGNQFRLRFNTERGLKYTQSMAEQFVLHELIVHCSQMANWHHLIASKKVANFFGLTTVHSPEQFGMEGVALLLPLMVPDFLTPTNAELIKLRVYMEHFKHTVFGNVHIMINEGSSIGECREYLNGFLPWWDQKDFENDLRNRSVNPLFSSYQYVYAAGSDYFLNKVEDTACANKMRPFLEKFYGEYMTLEDIAEFFDNKIE